MAVAQIRKLWPFCAYRCVASATVKTRTTYTTNRRTLMILKNSKSQKKNVDSEHLDQQLHVPVMVNETIEMLQPRDQQLIIDMTFGAGGHTREIIKQAPHCKVIALDRDPVAFDLAQRLATQHSQGQITPLLGKFSDLPTLLGSLGILPGTVDGILMDVGVSSMQFDSPSRGFGLSSDGPLDMRMDGDRLPNQISAADVVNHLEEHDLCHVIKKYGEERRAREIARQIVEARYTFGNITRTKQLAEIVANAFSDSYGRDKLHRQSHVATRTFQALRIFINNELNELSNAIDISHKFLKVGGRCVALTFHSLEDRIVKRHFHGIDLDEKVNSGLADKFRQSKRVHSLAEMDNFMGKRWEAVSRKVVSLTYEEGLKHPRARSAKIH